MPVQAVSSGQSRLEDNLADAHPPLMAVCRRSSHLETFYRQLHIAYFDRATVARYRAFAIERLAVCIQFLQAARAQPLIVVCNGQRLLFRVRLATYGAVHSFSPGQFIALYAPI